MFSSTWISTTEFFGLYQESVPEAQGETLVSIAHKMNQLGFTKTRERRVMIEKYEEKDGEAHRNGDRGIQKKRRDKYVPVLLLS